MIKILAACSIVVGVVAVVLGVVVVGAPCGVVLVVDQVPHVLLLNFQLVGRMLIAVARTHRCSTARMVVASTT
jgi:hypothetical protein